MAQVGRGKSNERPEAGLAAAELAAALNAAMRIRSEALAVTWPLEPFMHSGTAAADPESLYRGIAPMLPHLKSSAKEFAKAGHRAVAEGDIKAAEALALQARAQVRIINATGQLKLALSYK